MKSVNYQNLFFIVVSWLVIILAILFAMYRYNYVERKIYNQNLEDAIGILSGFYASGNNISEYLAGTDNPYARYYYLLNHPEGTFPAIVRDWSHDPADTGERIKNHAQVTGPLLKYEIKDIHFWHTFYYCDGAKPDTFIFSCECTYANTIQDEQIMIHVTDEGLFQITSYEVDYYPGGRKG